ncbi:hypothetical protein A2164_00840 [Candidatus Curtissbacteria bacterium RBG_13_35_7]|uniref:Uncharacterized protein n=1 Tax=Candidatus Curtissbacteria bacterium RBG_13_35_7 TaxID=1797705 RepID=A0A1F5G115_9BACT|nr:MAG: hypothetical protein A2164_00840 [Candidatus Curtissbacteria bacterium RBG_13_35_7]
MFKKVILNTGWQIVGKTASASSTLLITLLIGRSLGPAGYGDFSKIFVFVGYFYIFADFGINSIFVKVAQSQSINKLFRTLLGLRLITAFFLALIAIIIAFFLPYNPQMATGFSPLVKIGILIASLTIISQSLFTTASAVFQKNLRYDLSAIATFIGSLVMLITATIISYSTKSLLPFVFIFIVGGFTYVCVSLFLIVNKFNLAIKPIFNKNQSINLLTASWPIGIALVLNLLYFRLDVFILAGFRQSIEVGLYNFGYQFFQTSLAVPIFFANALFPLLLKSFKQNITQFNKQIRSWAIYLLLFSLALTVFLFAISYLIPVYDQRYIGSDLALRILSLGMPFFFLSALFWHLLIIYGKQKLLIYVYLAGAIFNLLANLIFIPTYGFLAAAVITVISEILITILLLISIKIMAKNLHPVTLNLQPES